MPSKRLPPKVHEKHGRYYLVDQNKWRPLSRIEDGIRELHRQLAILTDQPPNTMAGIFAAYAESALLELKKPTQKQYDYFLFGILNHTFGHLLPSEIDDSTVAQYLELRKKQAAAVAGNRERACLSSVFEYAMRMGWARRNPCRGVRRNKERPSKVRIESGDLSAAIDRAPKHFAPVMQFAYMTGFRMTDVIAFRVSDVTPKGLAFTESKTGKRSIMAWTPALRGLIREIQEARPEVEHDRLLTNRFGKPLSMWGIISNMRRLGVEWTFRGIRAKAQTDGGERNVLGHTGQMREVYTRERKLVPVR